MIICSCNVISDHEVRIALASKPLRTIGGLFRYLGCTAQCGRCARSIKRIMDEPRRPANADRGALKPQLSPAARPGLTPRAALEKLAERSEAAQRKARNRCTDDGLPVHSFRSLLADLATVTRNVMAMDGAPEASFVLYPQLTPVQATAGPRAARSQNCPWRWPQPSSRAVGFGVGDRTVLAYVRLQDLCVCVKLSQKTRE